MENPGLTQRGSAILSFHDRCVELFETHFHRLYRYIDRVSGDPELAADLAQEAFIKLYRRGSPVLL